MTLGDAGRKKYFNDFLFHFGQKMRLTLCGVEHELSNFVYFLDRLAKTPIITCNLHYSAPYFGVRLPEIWDMIMQSLWKLFL